jgi:hypothetical protein
MTSVLYPLPRIMPGELMLALWLVAAIATILVGYLALTMRPWRVIVPIMVVGSYCLAVVRNGITFRLQRANLRQPNRSTKPFIGSLKPLARSPATPIASRCFRLHPEMTNWSTSASSVSVGSWSLESRKSGTCSMIR